jgi:hypothetical protein
MSTVMMVTVSPMMDARYAKLTRGGRAQAGVQQQLQCARTAVTGSENPVNNVMMVTSFQMMDAQLVLTNATIVATQRRKPLRNVIQAIYLMEGVPIVPLIHIGLASVVLLQPRTLVHSSAPMELCLGGRRVIQGNRDLKDALIAKWLLAGFVWVNRVFAVRMYVGTVCVTYLASNVTLATRRVPQGAVQHARS